MGIRPDKLGWTEEDKQKAATELMNARQNLKELGSLARESDRERVKKAKQKYQQVTGRKA